MSGDKLRAQVGEIDRQRARNYQHPYPLIGEDGKRLGWLDGGEPGEWGTIEVSANGIWSWEREPQ